MSDKYKDPSNIDEIINQIKSFQSIGDIRNIIENTFPTLIQGLIVSYSVDYPTLENNWVKICEMNKVEKGMIVLVDELYFDEDHKLLKIFSEIFTRSGFVIRRKEELISCKNCKNAIPSFKVYQKMKENKIKVPESWNEKCLKC